MTDTELHFMLPFNQSNAGPQVDTCVIVPVKNEAESLATTLNSLRDQIDEQGNPISTDTYEVVLLVNNSDDGSLEIALAFKAANPSFRLTVAAVNLPAQLANIGTVRRLLMDEAYRRFKISGHARGIIASIDGDTIADPQWIYHIRQEISLGNDAVGGRIFTREQAGTAEEAYLQDMTYRSLLTEVEQLLFPQVNDPLPRHFQFFGANMAVTCEYYQKSGGIPPVNCLEDMAFHKALILCDAKIRRSPKVKVVTSVRFDGRVEIGFSEQLKKWSDDRQHHRPQIVEESKHTILAYYLKGQLKAYWNRKSSFCDTSPLYLKDIALSLGVPQRWLKARLLAHDFFGACWEEVWEASIVRKNAVGAYEPIKDAINALEQFIKNPDISVFQTNLSGRYQLADKISA